MRGGVGSNLLRQLLLGGLLLLLHDLGDGGGGLLSLPLLELADLMAVVSMVRVVGVQKVELGIVDLVLSYPSFKFRSISKRREKELIPQPLQLLRPRTLPIPAAFLPHPSLPRVSTAETLPSAPGPSASSGLTQASSTTGSPSSSLLQLLCQSRHFQNPSRLLPFFCGKISLL